MNPGPHSPAVAQTWDEAREALYRAFADVPRPSKVTGCSHCVPEDADLPLLAVPVAQLSAATLASYAAKALTTWGDAGHLRYFAPRLIECVVENAPEFPAADVVVGKLALAGWLGWPTEQVDAVCHTLLSWWGLTLAGHGTFDADTVLCAIAATGSDLTPYLTAWSRSVTDGSVTLLEDLVTQAVQWSSPPRMCNPVWRDHFEAERQLLTWLTGGAAVGALAAAFERATDESLLERLSMLHTWLAPVLPMGDR